MKIAVNGATGFTGRLAVAELARRGIETVLCGRDLGRLRAAANGAEVRVADIADPAALAAAFEGCDAVVNCAGPFALLGEPVVRAAIAAGCHYVDTTGEQHFVRRVFERFAKDAENAGVTVVPAMADDGGPSDLIAHLTAARVAPVEDLTIAVRYLGGGPPSRGTVRSMLEIIEEEPLDYEDGGWHAAGPARRTSVLFPGGEVPVAKLALPGVVTVPHHVRARRVEGLADADLVAGLGGLTPELAETLPEGPDEELRRAQRWTIVVEAVGSGVARGVVEGGDNYGTTAVIAVEAACRLAAGGVPAGVLAPSQAFDPAGFLDALAGVTWSVG